MSDDVPRFSIRFLQWFCPTKLYEGIEGDLLEQFEKDVENFGAKQARRKFMWNVMRFFRADIILRNRFSIHFIHASMIRNYLIVAFRNILKTKVPDVKVRGKLLYEILNNDNIKIFLSRSFSQYD